MLFGSVVVPAVERVVGTEFDRKIAGKEGEHADQGSETRALPIGYDAHGDARSVHAQIRSGSLAMSDEVRRAAGRQEERTMTLLCVAESCSFRRIGEPMLSRHTGDN